MLLQSEASTLDDRISKSRGVRNAGRISLGGRQPNRVQARLLYYFVGRRDFFQKRSGMLLFGILPKEVSEKLRLSSGLLPISMTPLAFYLLTWSSLHHWQLK
jgi:hypothetical protein